MKTTLCFLLIFAVLTFQTASAQNPDAQMTTASHSQTESNLSADLASQALADPDVKAAHETAVIFLEEAFSKDYHDAERMMNPDSPQKGKMSISELRRNRSDYIKQAVESKEKFGSVENRETTSYGKGKQLAERPPEEVYFQFIFKTTYASGKFTSHHVMVLKKDGAFWIERFM